MIVEFWKAYFEKLAKHGHVDGKRVHGMGEVALGQDVIDEIDHALERFLFALVHNLEYERGDDVEALTIAYRFVVACVGEQHAFEQSSIAVVLVGSAAERRASGSMQVFDDLHAELVVVGIGSFVEGYAAYPRPIQVEVGYVFLRQIEPDLYFVQKFHWF